MADGGRCSQERRRSSRNRNQAPGSTLECLLHEELGSEGYWTAVNSVCEPATPPWTLTDAQVRAVVGRVRAGRDLTPKSWPGGARVAVGLSFDLDNETETVRNYRQRVRQCEALGEFAMAEEIRRILVNEQEHQIDLATALGIDVPVILSNETR